MGLSHLLTRRVFLSKPGLLAFSLWTKAGRFAVPFLKLLMPKGLILGHHLKDHPSLPSKKKVYGTSRTMTLFPSFPVSKKRWKKTSRILPPSPHPQPPSLCSKLWWQHCHRTKKIFRNLRSPGSSLRSEPRTKHHHEWICFGAKGP